MAADYKNKREMLRRLGRRIQQLRDLKGLTIDDMAGTLDIPRAEWLTYEQGKDLDLITIIHICKILDIPLTDFFEDGF